MFVWDNALLFILVYSNSLAYICLFFLLLLLLIAASQTFIESGTQTDPIETADFGKSDLHCILCSVLSTHLLIPCVFSDDDGWTCGEEESTGEEKGANEDTTASTGEEKEGTGCRGG